MRRGLGLGGAACAALAAGVLYLAYVYTPFAETGYASAFLAGQETDRVEVEGFRLHHLDEGDGPPVLLLHGGGTWLYSYRDTIAPLARSFRVLAVDMPGHGYTEPLASVPRYDFETTDQVLLDFLDAKQIEQVSLVGHSWGGDWALHFAQRHPERVHKLVLMGSGPGETENLAWEALKVPLLGELMVKLFGRRQVQRELEFAFSDPGLVTAEMVSEVYAPVSRPGNRLAQMEYARHLDPQAYQAGLATTHTPTLVLWGEHDRYGGPRLGRALADSLPNARFEQVDGAGHNAHEEKPREVNRFLLDFLSPG